MKWRISALCFVTVFFISLASPAGAREVINSSSSQEEVSVFWDMFMENGAFTSGSMFGVSPKNGEPYVELFEVSGTPITCDDGTPGTLVEFVFGSGPGTVTIDGRYRSASAEAVLDLFVESFEECFFGDGEVSPENGGGGTVIENVPVSLSAEGTSSLIRSKFSDSFHIPSDVNQNSSFEFRLREGDGTATFGDEERSGFAQIGKVSWRFHSNTP